MKVIAVGENVVVRKINVDNITNGGIVLPHNISPESFIRGEVLSVGKDIIDIKEGDVVAYSEHGGQDMLTKEKEILKVLKYGEVYCIINE